MNSYNSLEKVFVNKFYNFLREIIENKSKEIEVINSKLVFYMNLKKFKDTKDICYLEDIDQELLDEDIKKTMKLISYLSNENLKQIPQYTDAINKLLDISIISNCESEINATNNKIDFLKEEIKEINKILMNENFNIEKFALLLADSGLNKDEQITILSNAVYSLCPNKKEEYKEEIKEIDKEVINEDFNINSLIDDAKKFYEQYYYVISSDDEKVKSERKGNYYLIDLIINENEVDTTKSNFEILAILLYELKNILIKLENNQNKVENTIDDLKELKELSSKVSKYTSYGNDLVEDLKKLHLPKEEENISRNKIIYLTDDEDEILFDIKRGKFTREEIKLAASTIRKLENSDPEDDIKMVRGLSNNSRKIFAIKSSNIVCTYTRLSNNIVLVIMIGKNNEVYDDTKQAEKKYHEKIEYLEGASYFKPQMLVESESKITEEIKEIFTATNMTK